MPIVVNDAFNIEIYTEPCMSCYKHIQYHTAEAFESSQVTGRKAIIWKKDCISHFNNQTLNSSLLK